MGLDHRSGIKRSLAHLNQEPPPPSPSSERTSLDANRQLISHHHHASPAHKKSQRRRTQNQRGRFDAFAGEHGLVHHVFQFLDFQTHLHIRSLNRTWQEIIRHLQIDHLDLSHVCPTVLDQAITCIMSSCYSMIKSIRCSGQRDMTDRMFLTFISRYWTNLEHLEIQHCVRLTDKVLVAILDSAASSRLKVLDCTGCVHMSGLDADFGHLTGHLGQLEHLYLGRTHLRVDASLSVFLNSHEMKQHFPKLVLVDIQHTPALAQVMSSNPALSRLLDRMRTWSGNPIMDNNQVPDEHDDFISTWSSKVLAQLDLEMTSDAPSEMWWTIPRANTSALVNLTLDTVEYNTPLMVASKAGHVAKMQSLLTAGASTDLRNILNGMSALNLACQGGHLGAVRLLLEFGAECWIEEAAGQRNPPSPVIYYAVEGHHVAVLETLLHHARHQFMSTISLALVRDLKLGLFVACESGQEDLVKLLLTALAFVQSSRSSHANLSSRGISTPTTPTTTTTRDHHRHIMTQAGETSEDITPLYIACQMGHVSIVSLLLEHGANVHVKRKLNGVSCLYIAAQEGHAAVVQLLLRARARPDDQMHDRASALHIACRMGHRSVIRHLLSAKANLDAQTRCGLTPLFIACQEGHEDIVSELLLAGANVEVQIFDGATPLFVASQNGFHRIVTQLLAYRAHTERTKTNQATPLHVAAQMGHHEVVRALLEAGASVHAFTPAGGFPLHFARRYGHTSLFQVLLRKWVNQLVVVQHPHARLGLRSVD